MSFATVAVAMSAAGAVNGAISAGANARAQARQLAFEADMSDLNARMAETAAQRTLEAGGREAQRSRMQTAALKGRQRAAMAANGLALDEGSPLNVLTATDYIGEMDANTIEANAIAAAWGQRVDATNQRGAATRSRAAAGTINPTAATASSLIGSAGQVASSWYSLGKTGATSAPTPPAGGQTGRLSGFWGS